MSRPLRIEYPGAWYHVMNRGRRAEKIFLTKSDFGLFVDVLKETAEAWKVHVVAYCLMPNRYHLLIQTQEANISRCMRHLNGVYTQRFNRVHRVDGQLFRGRYKSILVDKDAYLLQLVRYIHRNPFRAGLANSPGAYEWSSHRGYLSQEKKWAWLFKGYILSMLSKSQRDQIRAYRDFMAQEDSEEIRSVFQRGKWPSVLGSDRFVRWIKERYFTESRDDEIPQAKELAPSTEDIKKAVCEYYGVIDEQLFSSRRGQFNEPRNVAIYLTRLLRTDSLKQIADHYQMAKYSSVRSIVERMKRFRVEDKKLGKRVQVILSRIAKGQEQT